MQTIHSGLIEAGAVVKDSPGLNPVDLIFATNATPQGTGTVLTSPIVVTQPLTDNAPVVMPNVATVSTADKNYTPLFIAAGIGSLLLLSGKKMGSIGKKDKKKSLVPILLIGGAAAVWYFTQNNAAAAVPAPDYTGPTTGGNDVVTPPPAVQAPVFVAPVEVSTVIRSSVAANNLGWLQSAYPMFNSDYDRMTDGEIISLYQYLYGFVAQGYKLYRLPGNFTDGSWNTTLYDAIASIKAKYNLNI